MNEQNNNINNGKRPEKEFTSGTIRATVWNNEALSRDGKPISYRTVSFERSYKDKDGDWKTTSALRINDIPRATLVLGKAYEFLATNS